jgi:ornithine cyclodeaminase/alanine dehydrogenase-like protein (mu-crystallin family)
MTLFLTEQEVTSVLTMPDALACVEIAFRQQGLGDAQNLPRRRLRPPKGMLHLMAAALPSLGMMGYKAYSTTRGGAKFHVMLYSTNTGELLSIMQADRLGQMRTGAASGTATKYLANPDADTLALVGAGWQAESQLLAIAAVRPLKTVRVFSRNAEHRNAFAAKMSPLINLTITPAESAQAAVEGASIVVTITNSRTPVLQGAWLSAGAHVNAAGSNALNRAEIDDDVVRRAALITTDSLEQAKLECGDLLSAIERNLITWERVRELGDIIVKNGHIEPRKPDDITLFESHGVAMQDIATASRVYELAKERGLGCELEI